MICRDRRIIFIHIPKNGGTSIEDMLWPKPRKRKDLWNGYVRPGFNKYQAGGLQHLTASQIKQEVGAEMFHSCYRFATVRHPVDRLVSQFNYLNTRRDLRQLLGLQRGRTFSRYLERIQEVEHIQWKPQVDFLLDGGEISAELFRLETLNDEFPRLAEKIGLAGATLLHSKKSLQASNPENWVTLHKNDVTPAERALIGRLYAEDFERLGYPLGNS